MDVRISAPPYEGWVREKKTVPVPFINTYHQERLAFGDLVEKARLATDAGGTFMRP